MKVEAHKDRILERYSDDGARRVSAILGTAVFFALAPGFVVGLVPWWISRWHFLVPFSSYKPIRVFGAVLVVAGLPVLLESFTRFALQGIGTPAPVFPTKHLVVTGFYRYVRNPMYVAVTSMILGQALLFGDVRVLGYAAFIWLAAFLFVVAYEEPTMRRSFGAEYERFCAHIPRWIPRLTPWHEGIK